MISNMTQIYDTRFGQNVKPTVFLLRLWVSECVSVCVSGCFQPRHHFPLPPVIPLFFTSSIFSISSLTHSLPLSNLLCVPLSFSFFLSCIFLSSVPSFYSFEAYFLVCAGCGEEVGLGGCVRRVRENKREGEWFSQPYDLIHPSFLVSDRQREGEGEFFFT